MGQLLATLEGHHTETSAAAVSDLPVGYKSVAPATTTTMVMIPSLPVLAAVTPVDCSLHPGQPCVKMWKCKMKRKGARRVKGVLHAFPTSVCFHPRGSSASSITHIDLAGVDDVGITTRHTKYCVFLLTSMGRTFFRGMSSADVEDCHLVLSTLWAGLRGHLPAATLARAAPQPAPTYQRTPSDDLNKLQEVGRLEREYGMRAHPELPEAMAAIFLRAKQTTDLLRAYGLSPNVPATVNKTDTMLPVSMSSFWQAFTSQRWQDWPNVFMPIGHWRAKVGEWRVDSVGLSRQVAFTSKPPRKGVIEEALTETISTMQLACLVVNRKSLETRIHIAVVRLEYPKAKEWFELVDISRDKGFPLLQVLDYRWHEDAPTPLHSASSS
ncbi:uncharacterized protein ACA1_283490 [Acanthamoeba castellanii str. Neff]|uniref:GRAM domain containing protein n=1 Tax=Acanthamoeba castellanii (strain ATCC 30010 / Neff) TaxID=1257118 RepID=L8H7E6_ACACF|nr:uncharacterized protein ACA1_283490 [Acanthamoeba castellanii str. Neff]ELR21142.1 hypothetical protein ACA1_283490 [Acanthamoeba castellanii str. Neff]